MQFITLKIILKRLSCNEFQKKGKGGNCKRALKINQHDTVNTFFCSTAKRKYLVCNIGAYSLSNWYIIVLSYISKNKKCTFNWIYQFLVAVIEFWL